MSDKIVKFLGQLFWVCLIIFILFWFFNNKEEFFPIREIKRVPNPINPFDFL